MGEAKNIYFTCLKKIFVVKPPGFPAENRLNHHHGPTTLPPPSDVLLDAQQQTPNLKNSGWQARLFIPKEGCQNPEMWRHRRQTTGHQACASHSSEEHAQETQARVQGLRRKFVRRRGQRKDHPCFSHRRAEDRGKGFEGAASRRKSSCSCQRGGQEDEEEI